MRQYFLTRGTAQRNLDVRRRLRKAKLEKDGDIIIADNSFVHCDYQWHYRKGRRIIWYNTMIILTKQLEDELKKGIK